MLIAYFLRRLYVNFCWYALGLIIVLGSCDVLLRLPRLPTLSFIPAVFICMIPLVMQFAIPIASCLALQMTLGRLFATNAVMVIHFLSSSRRALLTATAAFSCSLLLIYTPLVMQWVPTSYDHGKRIIVTFARDHLINLEPGMFHHPSPEVMVYFKGRSRDASGNTIFEQLTIMISGDDGTEKPRHTVIVAKQGILLDKNLRLKNGTIHIMDGEKEYTSTFGATDVSIDTFIGEQMENITKGTQPKKEKKPKFLTFRELAACKDTSLPCYLEIHVRIVRVCMQLLFPFLALILVLLFGRLERMNTLLSIGVSMALLVLSYLHAGLGRALAMKGIGGLAFLYMLPALCLGIIMYGLLRTRRGEIA